MEYKVVYIAPVQRSDQSGQLIAQDLETVIKKYHAEGWNYERIESIQTWVQPSLCFALNGGKAGYSINQMIIFSR
ncbi:MAG: hypothetical protein MUC87_12670 [Bacteroidia bacterium]|jgi:hypothetical protein|nr:hypothetical protein [Bacteroidia bacterium]